MGQIKAPQRVKLLVGMLAQREAWLDAAAHAHVETQPTSSIMVPAAPHVGRRADGPAPGPEPAGETVVAARHHASVGLADGAA